MGLAAVVAIALLALAPQPAASAEPQLENPAIDMTGYLRVAADAAVHRATRRVSESKFLRLRGEPGTLVLDARSREKYDELHIDGAVNLSFPDLTISSLARLIPHRDTRILIYCNNNFTHAEEAFPSKLPAASLNLSTYIALYTYGYRNVYELGPLLDVRTSKLPFAGSTVAGAHPGAGEAPTIR